MSFIGAHKKALDPGLTSLFASSLGPVAPPPKSRYREAPKGALAEDSSEEDQDSDSDASESEDDDGTSESASSNPPSADEDSDGEASPGHKESVNEAALARIHASLVGDGPEKPNKKRKRSNQEDAPEDVYMEKIAREEAREEEKRSKKQKTKRAAERAQSGASDEDESDAESFTIPKHESLMDTNDAAADEVEKASRTVFLGNVSSEAIVSKAAEKKLKQHLASFIADLADNEPPHKVESIRYRSTAFASALPKRAAFAKKEVMDTTTKSTNAYVVYSTKIAAREAAKRLNGTVVLGRHLRVDSVAHPAKVDHRRCVFVGNLGFVDDESTEDGKKKKPPGDVEEGLWVQFSKAGKVESVRVPRDSKTRVGKGFAYVQFEDENGVEAALQFNEQKYPPLLPRKLRVVRAKAQKKKEKKPVAPTKASTPRSKGAYNAKVSEEQSSLQGRARAMLGKAAKAGAFKSAESFVFEGHRASSKQGTSGLKLGGKKGKKKGPNGRKSRSQAWKSSGGKK